VHDGRRGPVGQVTGPPQVRQDIVNSTAPGGGFRARHATTITGSAQRTPLRAARKLNIVRDSGGWKAELEAAVQHTPAPVIAGVCGLAAGLLSLFLLESAPRRAPAFAAALQSA